MTVQTDDELLSCTTCGSPVFEDESFCESCGVEAHGGTPTAGSVHGEEDLGIVAAVTDRGRRRPRNEDAFAVAAGPSRFVAVVCDGVASTANPDRAARAAAAAALESLEPLMSSAAWPDVPELHRRVEEAFDAAQAAVAGVEQGEPDGNDLAPSTTLVLAVGDHQQAVVANVGDSRAYWLADDPERSRALTIDDSVAQELIAQGALPEEALADPEAHVITRWIGADADSVSPTVTTHELADPGILLLCSDGLWNYFEDPSRMACLVPQGSPTPIAVARALTDAALAAGGSDNIAVVAARPAPDGVGTRGAGSGEVST